MRYLGTKKVVCPACGVELDVPLYHVDGINHYGMKFCHQCGNSLIYEPTDNDFKEALSDEEYNSLCERMADCANLGTEDGHIAADDILLEALEKMGYKKLTEIYLNLDKWYA